MLVAAFGTGMLAGMDCPLLYGMDKSDVGHRLSLLPVPLIMNAMRKGGLASAERY